MGTPTGNTRADAKNKFGLSGSSPIDPSDGEVFPKDSDVFKSGDSSKLKILTKPGTIVRATHPGKVGVIPLPDSGFVVRVDALPKGDALQGSGTTKYGPLGTVDVVPGEIVGVGTQLGTVASEKAGAETVFFYGVSANQSGTAAAEAAPEGEVGIAIVKSMQSDGIAPSQDVKLRKPPPEASDESPAMAPEPEDSALANLPTEGERVSNLPWQKNPDGPVVDYREQINQVYTHDFLVYINGVDVTKYVVESLTISIVDRDGWNEASLSLNNASDNFVITYANLGIGQPDGKPKFRSSDIAGEDKYSERAKKEIIDYKTDEKRNPFVDIENMKLVEAGKSTGLVNVNTTGSELGSVGNATSNVAPGSLQELGQKSVGGQKTVPQTDRRWQLGYQSTVFHKNDPIRIFRKNPIREADEWMPAFTGYLDNISYDTDYVTGKSNVKLKCYDIRAMISKMRVQTTAVTGVTNPRAIFRGKPESGVDSLFTDLLDPAIKFHPLSGRTYEDVMEFLITGTATQDPNLDTQFRDSGFSRGVGDFTVGERIFHRPGDEKTGEQPDSLEHWHSLCLFGYDGKLRVQGTQKKRIEVKGSEGSKEILDKPFNRRWLTQAEARKIGTETTHDGAWAPHSMFLHMLLPAEGTGARNLLDFDAFNANGNQLEFRGKLDILQDFSNRIDYQFWVTPMGDIVIEFPQYDFFPRDYGEYENVFRVNKHLQSDNIQDEAGEMTTAVIASGRISPASEANIEDQFQPKAVVVAPLMMIRYGVLEHELALPFISHAPSLKRLAQIAFQKKLAESNRMDMEFDYRPFILPNRPVENFERQRMALTTSVENQMKVFQSARTSISSRYVRRALFRQDGTLGFTLITGGTSVPISYRQIYEPGTQGLGSQGGRSDSSGVALVVQDNTTQGSGANLSEQNPGTGLSTTKPLLTPGNQTAVATINESVFSEFGFTPEMAGRFKAAGQMLSGFTETSRHISTDGFGMFMMKSDVRGDDLAAGAFGIGDSTDTTEQVGAAASYFSGLTEKYKGNLDDAMAEFSLGAEAIKNIDIRKEWDEGWGAVNKELGEAWEGLSQSLQDGWNVLFPGQTTPVDTETVASSAEAKALQAEAEAEGIIPADPGFQSSVGVLVFDNESERIALSDLRSSAEFKQADTEERARLVKEARGRANG
jgi:hypothetical protein